MKKETSEEYRMRVIKIVNNHMKKYKFKRMNFEELDKLCKIEY